ncbi:MAG TPA: UDP-N-acetylmuramoyl-L-alanine--D-glutamate ligase [Candidatus Paceibacterota bacterium]|nr:UDP-N-acetylmuramoyl-L-alanine--D-glutamate ligase [Candidatus Paceibacterota bacterium]
MKFRGKKVLVLGLGQLGGGVAVTNWLLSQGASVTVTDLKDDKALSASVRNVTAYLKRSAPDGAAYAEASSRLTWALGGHDSAMIRDNGIIMVNPDVPLSSPFVQEAYALGKTVVNEAGVFYGLWKGPTVGITGTRGKTTTATWTGHLLSGHRKTVVTGNSTVRPFLTVLDANDRATVAVTELPSFLLEHFSAAPDIAVVTNLYRDHLNRYRDFEHYARTKAAVFTGQGPRNHCIMNADDDWTPFMMGLGPKAKVWQVSSGPLKDGRGLYADRGWLWFLSGGMAERVVQTGDFARMHGAHNFRNLLTSALAAHLAGCPWPVIAQRIGTLPGVPYRQETVYRSGKLTVVNDTCATSPDGGIAALERFGGPNCILITGGTDRALEYGAWAKSLVRHVKPENTIFLAGSATDKMRKALKRSALGRRTYDSLEACFAAALERARYFVNATVLFSPASKSFEKFRNEYDRGQQFNALVKTHVRAR